METKELNSEEIQKFLKEALDSLCDKYKYAHLTIDEINIISKSALKKFSRADGTLKKFKNILESEFKRYIDINVYKNLDRGYRILKELVSECDLSSISKINAYLYNLVNELRNIDFDPSIQMFFQLFDENSNFLGIFNKIYEKYKNLIVKDKIDKVFDDNIANIISIYCMYKKIDIDYEDEVENKNTKKGSSENCDLTDTIKLYKSEMCEYKILSPEEEYSLGMKVQEGIKASEKLESDTLTDYERKELERLVKIKNLAHEKLVLHNLRLVFRVARKYTYTGIKFEDLIQEGNIGLMEAATRYDPLRGYRFSTYAMWWIRQKIYRSLGEQIGPVRIPVYMVDRDVTVAKAKQQILTTYNREATVEELSKMTGLKENDILKCLENLQPTKYFSESVFQGDRDPIELGDTLSSNDNIEDNCINSSMASAVIKAFENTKLTKFERDIIIRRFGLYGKERETLEMIARDYNCTREWVRQNEKKALKKLYANQDVKSCYDYVESNEYSKERIKRFSSTTRNDSPLQREKRSLRTRKSVYQVLSKYPRFVIDLVKEKELDDEDKRVLIKRNGDLDFNSVSGAIITDLEERQYKSIINKMIRCIRGYIANNRNEVYTYYYQNAIDKEVYWLLEPLVGGENAILVALNLGLTFDKEKYDIASLNCMFYLGQKILTSRIEESLKIIKESIINNIDNEELKAKFGF